MPFIEQLAQQAAGAATGGLLGIGLGAINDQRQYNQQQKLQKLQIAGSKELTDYNYAKQLQMWHDTSYSAQIAEMMRAGVNPGLLYGMSGGGGQTIGSGSGSQVQGADAPKGGGEAIATMGMGIQFQLLEAQKRVLETQADKNAAEAESVGGTQTEESQTRIKSLLQGITNAQAQKEMMKVETALKALELEVAKKTREDREDYIYYQTKIAMWAQAQAEREDYINKATVNEKVDIIRREATAALLRNELTKAQTANTKMQTTATEAEIKKWSTELQQGWSGLSIQEKEMRIKAFEATIHANYPGLWNVIGAGLQQGLRKLDEITGQEHMPLTPNTK